MSTCATILDALALESPSTVETTFEIIFVNITVKIFRSVGQLSTKNGSKVDMRPLAGGVAHAASFESTSLRTALNALNARHLASLSARRSAAADPDSVSRKQPCTQKQPTTKHHKAFALDGLKLQHYSAENKGPPKPFKAIIPAKCHPPVGCPCLG
jgi:hypothetical protein